MPQLLRNYKSQLSLVKAYWGLYLVTTKVLNRFYLLFSIYLLVFSYSLLCSVTCVLLDLNQL